MRLFTRRELFAAAGCALAGGLPERVWALARDARPVKITGIDLFDVEIPVNREEADSGKLCRYTVARIDTDAGVRRNSVRAWSTVS
jgi:hypothetical protein